MAPSGSHSWYLVETALLTFLKLEIRLWPLPLELETHLKKNWTELKKEPYCADKLVANVPFYLSTAPTCSRSDCEHKQPCISHFYSAMSITDCEPIPNQLLNYFQFASLHLRKNGCFFSRLWKMLTTVNTKNEFPICGKMLHTQLFFFLLHPPPCVAIKPAKEKHHCVFLSSGPCWRKWPLICRH